MSVTTCPSCNTPVPPGSIFCDNCGYDLRTVNAGAQSPAAATFHVPQASGEITCATCGHVNISGSAFCENCGSQLSQAQPAVHQPPPPPPIEKKPPEPAPKAPVHEPAYQPPPAPASGIGGNLVIQAANATLPIPPGKQTIVLGREDPVSGIFPDIDLDPYGAQEEGVGRRHAQLVLQGGQVFVEDLDSVNGTAVNKQRLAPRQPQPVGDGDEIRLGKMILIYHSR